MANILIVEDNETNRRLLVAWLSHAGHEIMEASDGAQGLSLARLRMPDLVISDILMPTMDGYEFVRLLRSDQSLRDVPVIFYTAYYHEAQARQLAVACSVSSVLVKPCSAGEFLRAVANALGSPPSPGPEPLEESFDREHLKVVTNKLAEQADALRVTKSRLEALTELNMQLASERDPRVLLEKVCQGARSLLGSRYAVLAVNGRSAADVPVFTTSGLEAIEARSPISLPGAGLLNRVVAERGSVRVASSDGRPLASILPNDYPLIQALVAVPIMSITQSFGWLCLMDKIGSGSFDAEDEHVLAILGAQAGRIYENGSLYREVQLHAAQLRAEMDHRERATEELRESEERFRQLAENIDDVFFLFSEDLSETLYVSPAYETIWGRKRASLREHPLPWMDSVHPGDVAMVQRHAPRGPALSRALKLEFRIQRPDAEIRWIVLRTFLVQGPARIVGVATDITHRKAAEVKIEHLNRVHAMLSGINSLIVRVKDRGELFREACRLAVEQGRFRIAWCGFIDSQSGELLPAAWAGDSADLLAGVKPDLHAAEGSATLVPAAMRLKQPVVSNFLATETRPILMIDELRARGYQGIAALPLIMEGRAVGCLVLITDERDFFTEAEMRLLTELSGDVSFALDHISKAERINYLAYYDALTGVANRSLLQERLTQQVDAAARSGRSVAVVVAEPERLGSVNDTYGRHAVDELVRQLAARLATCVGSVSELGRVGAEQFAIVLLDVRDETDIVLRVEELWRHWLGSAFVVADKEFRVVAKAGIALYPNDGSDAEALLKNAEAALKNARSSTEPFLFYTAQLGASAADTLALEMELRRALEHEEFVLYYQPKVDLETRTLQGVEALLRWRHPDRGVVCPAEFIGVLEETGLIVDVGLWVFRQACLDRSRWLEAGLRAPRVAVNVSTVQLKRADFVRSLGHIMRTAGREAGIDIEITESVIMDDANANIQKLKALRELGIEVAIDDFGTGYSSLGYLTKLPAQTLKIDRSFITTMLDDPGAMTLVSTIISLGRSLDLTVVAEGVESEEQAKILRLLRCNAMQGYLISKPVSFEEMRARLARPRS